MDHVLTLGDLIMFSLTSLPVITDVVVTDAGVAGGFFSFLLTAADVVCVNDFTTAL